MPMLKQCPHCKSALISYKDKYCKDCSNKIKQCKTEDNRLYNKEVRNKRDLKYTKFYASKEWQVTSSIVKNKYKGLCLMCLLKDNQIKTSDVVHHILEIKSDEGWEHRLDLDILITLCHACHNKLHGNYTKEDMNMLRELINEYNKIYLRKN